MFPGHLRRVSTDDARTSWWVNSISAIKLIFTSAITPGANRARRRVRDWAGPRRMGNGRGDCEVNDPADGGNPWITQRSASATDNKQNPGSRWAGFSYPTTRPFNATTMASNTLRGPTLVTAHILLACRRWFPVAYAISRILPLRAWLAVHPWISVFKSAAESRTGHSRQWARRHRRSSGYRVQRPRAPASSEGGLQTQLSRLGVGLDLSVSHRSDRWCGRGIANTSVLSSSSTTGAESAGIEQIIDMTVVVDIAAANAGGIPQTDGRGIVSSHIESHVQR